MNRHDMHRLAETFRYLRDRVKQDPPSEEDRHRLRTAIEAALSALPSGKTAPAPRRSRH